MNRRVDALAKVRGSVFHLAPVPVVYHLVRVPDLSSWHTALIADARSAMRPDSLEVPDVRHVLDLGRPQDLPDVPFWTESAPPAVGVWHRVPTNGFLGLPTPAVDRLNALISTHFAAAMEVAHGERAEPVITESWIQFYRDGDRKVLHNHERYGPPYPERCWAGAYYVDPGDPDPTQPYSGVFSFRIRGENHFVRPKPGLLLMWPADVLHEVHPFYGRRERVVVNFNLHADEAPLSQ